MGRERSRSVESKPNVSKVGNVGSGGSRRVWSFKRKREKTNEGLKRTEKKEDERVNFVMILGGTFFI